MKNNSLIYKTIFILYLLAVAVLCLMPTSSFPDVRPDIFGIPIDKIVHFIMFFPFPILAYAALKPATSNTLRPFIMTLIILSFGCNAATATEVAQKFLTDYRSADIFDLIADIISMCVSSVIIFIIELRRQNIK